MGAISKPTAYFRISARQEKAGTPDYDGYIQVSARTLRYTMRLPASFEELYKTAPGKVISPYDLYGRTRFGVRVLGQPADLSVDNMRELFALSLFTANELWREMISGVKSNLVVLVDTPEFPAQQFVLGSDTIRGLVVQTDAEVMDLLRKLG